MKRFLSMILVLVMVLSLVPVQAFAATIAYNPNSSGNVTITVQDQDGNRVTGATVRVTRSSNSYAVGEVGNGQYKFTRDSYSTFQTYTITVSRDGYTASTVSISGTTTSTVVTLTKNASAEWFEDFEVFYIADGNVPSNYAGWNDAVHYGPSANNVPLCIIKVNLTKLIEISQQDNAPVIYNQQGSTSSGNQYEFIPAGSRNDENYMQNVSRFWQAVLACTEDESIEAFQETGLFDKYMSYCLKKQSDSTQHSDGVLAVTPPVYVVELYENQTFFGGGLTDTAEDSKFLTAYDILDQYEAHLKQTITWEEDGKGKPLCQKKADGTEYYTGTYVDPATNKIHKIEVFQFDAQNAQPVEGSEIPYVKQTDTYYLAKYNMSVDAGTAIKYLVTYTDGVPEEVVFTDHEYNAQKYDVVPPYTGITVREDYTFLGWYKEGDSTGTIYSDADIAAMRVTGNMTFHAVWQPVPKYTGTVKIVLNGTYDAQTQTHTSGTLVDPSLLLKTNDHIHLYVSADGEEYIQLNHDATGTFSAELKNGNYSIYYAHQDGTDYVLASDQQLIMENMDRTRYLFFNSVTYDPMGGTLDGTTANRVDYYYSGSTVYTYGIAPVREGYIFTGWKSHHNLDFQPSQLLSSAIDHAIYLEAQWIKATDVYVHVTLDHYDSLGEPNKDSAMHDVSFTIDTRAGNTGDYSEVYNKSIQWDGTTAYTGTDYNYNCVLADDSHVTTYTALQPNLVGVPADNEYTVTSHKSGYVLQSITQQKDENGDLHIYVEFVFEPAMFDFIYYVELDEEAKQLDKSLWPAAVNVKITRWDQSGDDHNYDGEYGWNTLARQKFTYERVEIDANGVGATYPVWIKGTADDALLYRIEVVSYELPDGTIVAANDDENPDVTYVSESKRYFANIEVTGGKAPQGSELTGAWYDNNRQQGTVKAIVSIPVYTVTFVPNGGTLNGTRDNTVLEDQIIVPVVEDYVPQREGGYVFEGWYLVDENGNMTEQQIVSHTALTKDITLIAKWRDPMKVEGIVTTAATYEQVNEDGSVTIQYIYDHDRINSVTVLLQKQLPSGYYETVDQAHIALDYTQEGYYFQKTADLRVPVGVGSYCFENLPDDGTQYRIYILSANYHSAYQNEPESVTEALKYNTYEAYDYDALLGENDPKTATVNAHLHFEPASHDLLYKVDATAIGKDFQPDGAEILVTYDSDPAVIEPSMWTVISQMVFGDDLRGDQVKVEDGTGMGSTSVWNYIYDGATLYDYGIRLDSVTKDGVETQYEENPYYSVSYQAPAHYVDATGKQSQLLIATLTPKTYNINYVTNGGTMTGSYPSTHTWSFETQLADVVPYRYGYDFDGWYLDEALTQPLTADSIAAEVAEDVTFYAKWHRVNIHLQVVIDHTTEETGLSTNYDKTLYAQLTELEGTDYLPVAGYDKSYTKDYWHTRGDDVEWDVLEVPYLFYGLDAEGNYNVDVSMEGYYMVDSLDLVNIEGQIETVESGVERIVTDFGHTTVVDHYVVVCLQYSPDLLDLEFTVEMAETVEQGMYPASADVKVTCWYERPGIDHIEWSIITQHQNSVVEVDIDPETGIGAGSYPVWQWLDKSKNAPFYYRIEVVALKLQDGTIIHMDEKTESQFYIGGGYTATIFAENGCEIPVDIAADSTTVPANTTLTGAYGKATTGSNVYTQQGTLRAVIDLGKIVFHANNAEADCFDEETGDDVFRTYYPAGLGAAYSVNADGTITAFYDIPTFEYFTHNKYVFAGWYTEPDEEGVAMTWDQVYDLSDAGEVHLYAHWLETGEVAQEDDGKTDVGNYNGFDLVGTQIRTHVKDDKDHHGDMDSGLRFITVLSEELWSGIRGLNTQNEATAQYGFLLCKATTAQNYDVDQLQYKAANSNGQDTTQTHGFLNNVKCDGVTDHFNGVGYRLYTMVVTFKNLEGAALDAALEQQLIARSYLGYYDANGLYRYHYNNYTGDQSYHGCSSSYADTLAKEN